MSYVDDLEKLSELKKKKVITEAEYELHRANLLERGLTQTTEADNNQKSQTAYCLWALFLGGFGAHNFYAHRIGCAIAQLIIFFIVMIIIAAMVPVAMSTGLRPEQMNTAPLTFLGYILSGWVFLDICCVTQDGFGRPMRRSVTAQVICAVLLILWCILTA